MADAWRGSRDAVKGSYHAPRDTMGLAFSSAKEGCGSFFSSPRFQGASRAFEGGIETVAGAGFSLITMGTGVGPVVGFGIMAHGLDRTFTGLGQLYSGRGVDTVTSRALQACSVRRDWANATDDAFNFVATIGAFSMTKSLAAMTSYEAGAAAIAARNGEYASQGIYKTSTAKVGLQSASNPLKNTHYTKKVVFQMENNLKTARPDFHGFPRIVDNYANFGGKELIKGRDGLTRVKISLEGAYQGKNGHFEWIVDANKSVNHRLFVPNS